MRSEIARFERRLVRFNAVTFATTFGLLSAIGLFASTLVLLIKGGVNPGSTLGLLREYFPGFSISFGGALIGSLWAFATAFVLAIGPAYVYYHGVLESVRRSNRTSDENELLRLTAHVHLPTFAGSFGLFCGGSLFLATIWLVAKHQPGEVLGPHLSLLKHYLPGYTVSIPGAFLGLVYLFILGSLTFLAVGWIYNRIVQATPDVGSPS